MHWAAALRSVFVFDRRKWRPLAALRSSLGVALPIFLATAFGHPGVGVLAGLGALYAGISSGSGVYGARVQIMLSTGLIAAASTFIGTLVGHSDSLTILVVTLASLVGALYATSSQNANTIAVQGITVLIVMSGLNLPVEGAIGNAALVFVGAVIQAFLISLIYPMNPRLPERKAVADAYRSLAGFVETFPNDSPSPIPDAAAFEDARHILDDARSRHWRSEHERLLRLLRLAEALRAALVGLAQADMGLREKGRVDLAARSSVSLAAAFDTIADCVYAGKMDHLSRELTIPEGLDDSYLRWLNVMKRLLGRMDKVGNLPVEDDPLGLAIVAVGWRKLFSMLTRLPDLPPLQELAVRHALRYSGAVMVAIAVERLGNFPHGYWFPMTVAILLRADFGVTVSRSVSRLFGTVAGVILGLLIAWILHPSDAAFGYLSLAACVLVFGAFQPNYALYSLGITLYVIFSVTASGLHAKDAGVARLLATLAGTVVSMAVYWLWPPLHGKQLWEVLAEALREQVQFGELAMQGPAVDDLAVEKARNRARSLRVQTESLYQSASLEPRGLSPDELKLAQEAIVRLDTNAAEFLALWAQEDSPPSEYQRVIASSRDLQQAMEARIASNPA